MKILMTGGTGFLGRKLGKKLVAKGHEVHIVTRDPQKHQGLMPFPCEFVAWNQLASYLQKQKISHVIHLAGESVAAQRWSDRVKKEILQSRVQTTRDLIAAYVQSGVSVETFVSASAIGFYGDRNEEILDEKSAPGQGFLPEVCVSWENEAQKISTHFPQVRTCILRIGIVLGSDGGALEQMLPPFRDGYGAALGSGRQWMSWIHAEDLTEMFCWAMESSKAQGIYNAVSLDPIRNQELSLKLSKIFETHLLPNVPRLALQVLFGEMSQVLMASQRVLPYKFRNEGFQYKFSDIDTALADVVEALEAFETKIHYEIWVPQQVEKIFPFFENEKNLEDITPPWLHFKVLNKSTSKIQKGTSLDYQLKLHGIPLKWRARIEAFEENKFFIDSQERGPYKIWHHTHEFEPFQKGTLVKDTVRYKIKGSGLGFAAAGWKVHRDVQEIFKYRASKIRALFAP